MELTLDRPGDHLYIRSVSSAGIRISDRLYAGPVILSATLVLDDWEADTPQNLAEHHFEAVFELEPEVVLIGTGASQIFLRPELMMCFYRRGIGVEIMTTDAACRTFNVLAGEGRNVVAAMLPPGLTP
jgi:uncharacterized protein